MSRWIRNICWGHRTNVIQKIDTMPLCWWRSQHTYFFDYCVPEISLVFWSLSSGRQDWTRMDSGGCNPVPNAKRRHLKKLTCNGTLRQVFIRVYRLEIQSVMLLFSSSFVNCFPSPLLSGLTLPPHFPVWISILHTCIQCVRGGGGMGLWASDR